MPFNSITHSKRNQNLSIDCMSVMECLQNYHWPGQYSRHQQSWRDLIVENNLPIWLKTPKSWRHFITKPQPKKSFLWMGVKNFLYWFKPAASILLLVQRFKVAFFESGGRRGSRWRRTPIKLSHLLLRYPAHHKRKIRTLRVWASWDFPVIGWKNNIRKVYESVVYRNPFLHFIRLMFPRIK